MSGTYSFIDVSASLTGPTGSIDLGYGSAKLRRRYYGCDDRGKKHHDRRRRW